MVTQIPTNRSAFFACGSEFGLVGLKLPFSFFSLAKLGIIALSLKAMMYRRSYT